MKHWEYIGPVFIAIVFIMSLILFQEPVTEETEDVEQSPTEAAIKAFMEQIPSYRAIKAKVAELGGEV